MARKRGDITQQNSFEADFAAPLAAKEKSRNLQEMFDLTFKYEGMKSDVDYDPAFPETTGKTYRLKAQILCNLNLGAWGTVLSHWLPLGAGPGGGTRFETYTNGRWKRGEFAISGQGIYTPKADIADSQAAPTGTGGSVWDLVYLAVSKTEMDTALENTPTLSGANHFTGENNFGEDFFYKNRALEQQFAPKDAPTTGVFFSTPPVTNAAPTPITGGTQYAETSAVINNQGVSVPIPAKNIDVPFSSAVGKERIDITVARYSGGTVAYERVPGVEGNTGAVSGPSVPNGTLFVRNMKAGASSTTAGTPTTDLSQLEGRVMVVETKVKTFAYPIQLSYGATETTEKDYALKAAETITRINASPEIATVQYSKNGGAWVNVPTGATLAISRNLTDYLLYKVTHNAGKTSGQLSIIGTE